MSDEVFSRLLGEIDYGSFKKMYRDRFMQSTRNDGFVWEADAEGVSVIRLPEGNRNVILDSKMKKAIRGVQKELKLPPQDFGTLLEP